MERTQLLEVLAQVRAGTVSPAEAASQIGALPFTEIAHAVGSTVIDHHRELRTGVPEIVYGASKTPDQIASAMRELARTEGGAIATRVDATKAAAVSAQVPEATVHELARVVTLGTAPPRPRCARIAVVCAGTSDLAVAEEVSLVAEFLGAPVTRKADVVVAVAGMEAALPSVLGGLVDRPMIAVPTSVGYGVSIDGLVALAGMLSSCAPGITVVNIDNGVGAAVAAVRVARLAAAVPSEDAP